MSRDPGDIPQADRRLDLVQALSIARDLPVEALLQLESRRNLLPIRPAVQAALERAGAGEELREHEQNLLFWGLHALAAARDLDIFPLLLRLLRRPDDELETLLGDAITETVPRMIVSLYDGDWPGLRASILDRATNDVARWQLILAAARCAVDGRIPQPAMRALLVELDEGRLIGSSDHGWYGWESAIALLGLSELAPLVDAARRDGRLLEGVSSADEFAEALAAARASPDDVGRFDAIGVRHFGSALDELEALLRLTGGEEPPADEPLRNPLRDVGRNDPCPCGSGRKFKKCCLAAA